MPMRTWAEMRESITAALIRDTGHNVAWWNERMSGQPSVADEPALRTWLTGQGVTGYQQMLLVMERFGYPDYLLASADELLDGRYAGPKTTTSLVCGLAVTSSAARVTLVKIHE